MKPVSIPVFPAEKVDEFFWVFANLEQIFPVRFVKADTSSFPGSQQGIAFQTTGDFSGRYPLRCLVFLQSGVPSASFSQQVSFQNSPLVDERLRSRTLEEKWLPAMMPLDVPGDVLATVEGKPAWVYNNGPSQLDIVSLPVEVQIEKRMLWDNIQHHRFYFLAALIHFIYRILKGTGWTPPPLRAAFIIDDPNLRHETYGYFNARKVAELAREHNFHLSVATPPVDLGIASDDVVKLFRDNAKSLSLSIHGNNHLHRELSRHYSDDEARTLVCQMLGRVAAFERKSGLNVSPVVVLPNEMCSQQMFRMMQHFEIDALTASRPKPWLSTDTWVEEGFEEWDSLLCSYPCEYTEGFMPVIRRTKILDNLAYRALLNQPLVFYYHHDDFAAGYGGLMEVARIINSFGKVQWMSLSEMSRSNYEMRCEGDTLIVRPFSKCVVVTPPQGISRVILELPVTIQTLGLICNVNGMVTPLMNYGLTTDKIAVNEGKQIVIRLLSSLQYDCGTGKLHRQSLPVWLRRRSAELRDRVQPYFRPSRN